MQVVCGARGVASAMARWGVASAVARSRIPGHRLAQRHWASFSACDGVTGVQNGGGVHWKARGRMQAGGMPRAGMSSDS